MPTAKVRSVEITTFLTGIFICSSVEIDQIRKSGKVYCVCGGKATGFACRAIAFESLMCTCYPGCGKALFRNRSVTGHDFSRAAKAPKNEPVLAAADLYMAEKIPQGLKPDVFLLSLRHD
jgi:hypothetical protein